jgi:hypothetical protein
MSDELLEMVGDTVPCRDPECIGTAEVEVDGDHRFYVCEACGFEFGHKKSEGTSLNSDNCGIGVPESLRRRASAATQSAIQQEERAQPVMVQIGFGAPKE